ncbi:hypothetical protein OKW21_000339 [Catalinimonas alkaloidigena]|nr:hypothetical protein [Catalinimonas alkaloidigena]MDF9795076.1 hypothetical protein [Catalinimonas alkaloidigena]
MEGERPAASLQATKADQANPADCLHNKQKRVDILFLSRWSTAFLAK